MFYGSPQRLYYLVKGRKLNKGYNFTSSPNRPGTILEKWKISAGDWLFFFNGRREELRTKEYVAMRMSRPRKVFWPPPLPQEGVPTPQHISASRKRQKCVNELIRACEKKSSYPKGSCGDKTTWWMFKDASLGEEFSFLPLIVLNNSLGQVKGRCCWVTRKPFLNCSHKVGSTVNHSYLHFQVTGKSHYWGLCWSHEVRRPQWVVQTKQSNCNITRFRTREKDSNKTLGIEFTLDEIFIDNNRRKIICIQFKVLWKYHVSNVGFFF